MIHGPWFGKQNRTATFAPPIHAQMVELVDTQVSKTCIARCAGSTPALGTNIKILLRQDFFLKPETFEWSLQKAISNFRSFQAFT
jgi:hypothetical protein